MSDQADEALDLEITGLEETYNRDGLSGLNELISDRIRRQPPSGSSVYLLTNYQLRRISGNLNRWPTGQEDASGFINFNLEDTRFEPSRTINARARNFSLQGGYRLLVGRGIEDLLVARKRIIAALGWGIAIMIFLGLVGGALMSRGMLRRIDSITATSESIVSGNLSQRIPTRGTGDDFDRLAEQLNGMLDQIESLLESVRRISDNIAHDLRTPLTRLRNRLENLERNDLEFHDNLEQATKEADGLLSTFSALLRIARIETDDRKAGFKQIPLAELVSDVAELYEPLAEEKYQTLSVECKSDAQILADRDLLFQAVANLVDNAVKYTPENGVIQVTLEVIGSVAIIQVIDSGPGIPQTHHEKVLQRFYRIDPSRKDGSNGLGLSMVAAVCKLHGAKITMHNRDPGLVISLKLPLA
ncbi:MAG: signal transduction histidine kinase [Gammaproteobacteria bacterium]|jgi:signal transduction histidine kinase